MRRSCQSLIAVGALVGLTRPSAAAPSTKDSDIATHPGSCLAALREGGVAFSPASRPGIAIAVSLEGPIDGITITGASPMVLDCSMVVSLLHAAPSLRALGFDHANISSGYSRRNVRGTKHPSKHSYGLAVDISSLTGPSTGTLRLDRDFEQGLGTTADCIGQPLTEGGALLKIAQCQLVHSGLFYLVLSPDYDDAHHDHFHLEAKPWGTRTALRSTKAAIH